MYARTKIKLQTYLYATSRLTVSTLYKDVTHLSIFAFTLTNNFALLKSTSFSGGIFLLLKLYPGASCIIKTEASLYDAV